MIIPEALAASAIGVGGAPTVVFPSVNITITLAFDDVGSNSCTALVKASAWLVSPPAEMPSTAALSVATEVISCASTLALLAKLTMPMRLPEPIFQSELSVDSSIISMNVFAPAFIFASGAPVMLPERSKTSTISVGFETISGVAVSASVTFNVPSQSI